MSRRTTAIAAALSVLALGSPLITANANPLARQYFDQGIEKYDSGNYQGAILDYTKAIEIDPNNANAFVNRGIAKGDSKKGFLDAISDFSKAIAIDPKYAPAYYNRGRVKFNMEDFLGAISDYSKAIENNPKYTDAYVYRGVTKKTIGNGKMEGACSDWRKAASLGDMDAAEWVRDQCQ